MHFLVFTEPCSETNNTVQRTQTHTEFAVTKLKRFASMLTLLLLTFIDLMFFASGNLPPAALGPGLKSLGPRNGHVSTSTQVSRWDPNSHLVPMVSGLTVWNLFVDIFLIIFELDFLGRLLINE